MLGLGVGLSEEEIAAMDDPQRSPSFDEMDRLVLRYAEELTRENIVVDEVYDALAAKLDTTELMELAATVGLAAMVNRVHATFQTAVDPETMARVGDTGLCTINRGG